MHFWHNNHHLVIIVAEIKKLQIQHFDYWTFKSLICVCKLKLYAVFSVTRSFLGTRAICTMKMTFQNLTNIFNIK